MSPGRQIKTSLGRQFGTSLGWSNRIFRRYPRDVGGGFPRYVLGTNIYQLGKNKTLSIKENLDEVRPYLKDIIKNLKKSDK